MPASLIGRLGTWWNGVKLGILRWPAGRTRLGALAFQAVLVLVAVPLSANLPGSGGTNPLGAWRLKEPAPLGTSAASLRGVSALRPGALATGELQLVGLQAVLPAEKIELPDGSPFFIRPIFMAGHRPASMQEIVGTYGMGLTFTGTFSGPGVGAVEVTGDLNSGLSLPAMHGEGDYVLSGVRVWKEGRPYQSALPPEMNGRNDLRLTFRREILDTFKAARDARRRPTLALRHRWRRRLRRLRMQLQLLDALAHDRACSRAVRVAARRVLA